MGRINFNGKKISSKAVNEILETIASKLGVVNVTSGDRDFVPKGGSKTSDHLHHCAADIHVVGMTDKKLFATLAAHTKEYFGKHAANVQLILHGSNTATGGPHVHIGVAEKRHNLDCMVEGNCAATKGVYAHTTNAEAGSAGKDPKLVAKHTDKPHDNHAQVAKHTDVKHGKEQKVAAKHPDPKHDKEHKVAAKPDKDTKAVAKHSDAKHDKTKVASNAGKKKKLSAEATIDMDKHAAALHDAGVIHSTPTKTGHLAEASQSVPNALGAQKDASYSV